VFGNVGASHHRGASRLLPLNPCPPRAGFFIPGAGIEPACLAVEARLPNSYDANSAARQRLRSGS
jgi:hypothetical protein